MYSLQNFEWYNDLQMLNLKDCGGQRSQNIILEYIQIFPAKLCETIKAILRTKPPKYKGVQLHCHSILSLDVRPQ
jgi:hypothetical protein